ncbi:50S ribosomal protein L35ae [Candidatus Bathyarchaeota archaeon]|nr:MAG: 50S ribosomal protein L35ae [Candidatus Bathyarchaeota archaeon]
MQQVRDLQRAGADEGPPLPCERAEMTPDGSEVDWMSSVREGLILNYRLGRKTQYPKECLIKVLGAEPKEAGQMVGWKVAWPAEAPKIHGRVVSLHGKRGTLRVRFSRGVLGQALNSRVKIYE